jgi:hypothetical protein
LLHIDENQGKRSKNNIQSNLVEIVFFAKGSETTLYMPVFIFRDWFVVLHLELQVPGSDEPYLMTTFLAF